MYKISLYHYPKPAVGYPSSINPVALFNYKTYGSAG
ncbi:hypothetical protein SLEP1_g238 [Rubroshorea leprosula]|uniref:Uncharacterized protein n=1 Tax=Rubroshorea leprosula TaxID=152421 RepID=A0AAV5HKB1_9ROSI|nr:hypothetical protein SLEP1_g238 [Rubroshorea leprosula]